MSNSSSPIVLPGNAFDNFVNSIRSDQTRDHYIFSLKKYMDYQKVADVNDLLLLSSIDTRLISAKIIDFILYLRQKKQLSASTINVYVSAVMHFYSMNDVTLNRKKIGMYIGEYIKKRKDRAYTTEEIQRLLDFCDERTRALVLLFASTGMRLGAIPSLQLRHFQRVKEYNSYKVTIYEGTKEEYYCFTTPEAAKAIDSYLEYRERSGEKLTESSSLFREQFDVVDPFSCKHPKPITLKALAKILRERLHRSGVMPVTAMVEAQEKGTQRNEVARAHGFRKLVTTNMIRAKVNAEAREMLLGHSIGLNKAYYRPTEDDLLQEYLKVVNLLTINEENKLRRQLESEKNKEDELEAMKEQFSNMQSQIQSLIMAFANIKEQTHFDSMAKTLYDSNILGKEATAISTTPTSSQDPTTTTTTAATAAAKAAKTTHKDSRKSGLSCNY